MPVFGGFRRAGRLPMTQPCFGIDGKFYDNLRVLLIVETDLGL